MAKHPLEPAKPDAETARLMANSLHYPYIVLRSELQNQLGLWSNDEETRHREQKKNARFIKELRRAMKILADHDGR